ncbi:MAG: DUF4249 domain-containing protein [Bacteroidota bacterium]
MRNISFIILLFISLTACEKVIDIDLNESDPQLVIEANLQAGEQEFVVDITQTTSYFDNQLPKAVENAIVHLRTEDDAEIALSYQSGRYVGLVNATPNQTYTLEVEVEGQIYQAASYLPEKVALIALEAEFQAARGPIDEGYLVYSRFEDHANTKNYYRLLHKVDGTLRNGGEDLQVVDDNFFNGGMARLPLFQKIFNSGETVEVILQHFDAASFDYFNSLGDVVSSGGGGPAGGSAAPGNPNTNWSNGALGYFSAFSSDTLAVEIPE